MPPLEQWLVIIVLVCALAALRAEENIISRWLAISLLFSFAMPLHSQLLVSWSRLILSTVQIPKG